LGAEQAPSGWRGSSGRAAKVTSQKDDVGNMQRVVGVESMESVLDGTRWRWVEEV
jgi:hypothetical protein